jgi:hypothetical protein
MPKFTGCGKAERSTLQGMSTPEHTKIVSRTRGVSVEIGVGPHGASQKEGDFGGLVSNNPFKSLAQAGYMHANPGILGKKGLSEWDAASKGRKIPKHVKSK